MTVSPVGPQHKNVTQQNLLLLLSLLYVLHTR